MKTHPKLKAKDTALGIVEAAERLFSQIGFEKTTVADIARELSMSPANVYRFYSAKAEINEAVGRRLFKEIQVALDEILSQQGLAREKLRASIQAVEKANAQRLASDPKLHEMIELAFAENWSIVQEHLQELERAFKEIILQGSRDGEFNVEDHDLSARLVRWACLRFYHPGLIVLCAPDEAPTLDQMVDFCLASLAK
jgi:AcrR family transcriptional regulator